ncbi:MAG: cell division protein FtsZ, partial [Desulfobacterales bacterium]|nr:cell division protein FtsZ [Desulfobacterales bacterium]
SVDESLGDEMRVTVIATGIGAEVEAARPAEREREKAKEAERRVVQPLRGKVRDVTPEDVVRADLADLDEPTFIRNRRGVGESSGALHRGVGRMALDDGDLEVPTFLRRKAD